MEKLQIVLADDHALLRAGLAALINAQADMEVVAQAANCEEALSAVLKTRPQVLVLDLSMPGGGSIQLIEKLKTQAPATRVLVVTTHDDPAYLRATLAAGCVGYLVKTAGDVEMLSALRTVAQGRTVINLSLSAAEMQAALGGADAKSKASPVSQLSEREREVLQYLARGFTNQQIAAKLFLSVKTIETYRSRIGEKLGLRDRAELVAFAMEHHLLADEASDLT